jgi:hypothetical protein
VNESGPHDEPPEDDDFDAAVIRNIYEVFLVPEIEARGGPQVVGPVHKAVVLLDPANGVTVLLNDDAEVVVSVRATRPIEAGEEITQDDFDSVEDVRPATVPDDAGWVALAVMPDGTHVAGFDFRRNRGKGRALLALADDYLATAKGALAAGRSGPSIDSAHTAAELAVTTLMYLTDDEPVKRARNRHSRRLSWLRDFTRLGNAPSPLHAAMIRLTNLRSAARYGEPTLDLREGEPGSLIAAVEELVDHARSRVGPPHPRLGDAPGHTERTPKDGRVN